ncbi:helix-turn-helix domain-containing protein, partial [Nocardia sp. NPDC050799]|uniref:helix-turn-helix domain-containing protein n=1 Tax=Nocardia sp. NPDC050799 TaxID=3154842 RepID=UPI0033D9D847
DFTRPDGPADRTARLAGLLGVPVSEVANQIAALERNGSLDPIRELLQPAGIAPAAAEALRQHVEATAPATTLQRALFTDEQALNHMTPLRDRLAAELGLRIADVDGAEGMRTLEPALTEARDALAAALGYPVAGINPGIARDILGEAVGDHLPAVNIAESDVRDDAASAAADSGPLGHDSRHGTSQDAAAQKSDTQNSDVDRETADDIVAAASRYLALSALLDSVVQIHRRSPNSCVNNAVTGMRVLCPDNAGRFRVPPTSLEGYDRETVRDIFGAGLEETGSLDEVVESLKSRPGGISVLVYKWKDTRANGTSTEADEHMVLLVNDSISVDEPNLVVVDLAASRDRNTDNDYGPRDLRNRRTLLNKAIGFDDWRREQEVFINRMPADERRFETIEFDRDGNLVSGSRAEAPDAETLPPSQRVDVPSAMQDEIDAIPVGQPGTDEAMLVRSGAAGDISNDRRRDEFRPVGSRPHDGPDHITDNPGPTPESARPTANTTPGSAAAASGAPDSIGSKPSHSAADSSSPNSANALNRARGAWITARRDDKGRRDGRTMTAADLAGAVDVDPSTMSRIERGSTRPRPGLFVKIGRALGVPRSEFVDIARNVYPDADFDLAPAAYPLDAPGRWLSAMLHDRDMSWNELVEASGISAKYLNSIGKGETVPGAAVFLSLCQELNLGAEAIGTAADRFFPNTPADLAPTAYAREERGLWLRAQRNDHGISDEELAQAAGIGTERLRSVERAERELGVVDFLSVCKALGLEREAIDTAADRFFPGVRVGLDPAAYAPEEHGLWLRALRYDRGISPEEVAEAAGISTIHLRSIETGERAPGVVVFLSLCDALGIETDVTGRAAGRFYPEARFDLDRTAYTSGEQGLWFRALRYHYRLQRSDVADDTGLTDRYIGQIERGERTPSRRAFRLLGRELGIGPIDLDAAEDHFSASALTDEPGLRFDDLTAGDEAQADLVERQIAGLLEGWSEPAYVREIAAAVGASIRWGQGPISLRVELDAEAVHVDLVDITGDHSYVRVEWRLGRTPGPVERAAEPPVERAAEDIDLDRLMEMFGESEPEEIPPYQREVRRIRNAVEARLLEYDADISGDLVDSVMRAVSELVTNAKKHLHSNASSAGLAPEEVLDLATRGAGDDHQVHLAVTNDIAPGVAAKLPKWTADEQAADREGGRGTQLVIAESTVAVRHITFANGKNTIE